MTTPKTSLVIWTVKWVVLQVQEYITSDDAHQKTTQMTTHMITQMTTPDNNIR
jgi:hypothetical protein